MTALKTTSLIELLTRLDTALDHPVELCVVGGAALLLLQSDRSTPDIDVLDTLSPLDRVSVLMAARKAGLDVDQGSLDLMDGPYLQFLAPFSIRLPPHEPATGRWPDGNLSVALWEGRCLRVVCPPYGILAASKLIRGSDADLQDVAFMIAHDLVDAKAIKMAGNQYSFIDREDIQGNLQLIELILQHRPEPAAPKMRMVI
jgi:hypothetical protein